MSAQISTGRRRQRSTHAPAGSAMRRKASCVHAASAPTSNVVASRVMTASKGSASCVTELPTSLTV